MSGSWLTVIAQSLLVYELTSSGIYLGLIAACQFVPVIFFSSWAGLVADSYNKRHALIALQSFALLQAVGLAAVATMDSPPILVLCLFAALRGSTATFDLPIRRTMVVETVPPHLTANAIALNSATMTGALVFGAALGGVLVTAFGYSLTFLADAGTYAAAILMLWRIRPSNLSASEPAPRKRGQLRQTFATARTSPELRTALLLSSFTGASYNFAVVLPILVADGFHRPTAWFTYLYSSLSFGSVLGALFVARQLTVDIQLLARAAFAFGVSTIALGLNPIFFLAFPIATLIGMSAFALLSATVIIIQTRSDPKMQGQMVGFHSTASLGVMALSAPLVGWLCESAGPRVGLLMTGSSCLLASVWARSKSG